MSNIVFVCTGNLCRSVMAEYIVKQKCAAAGRAVHRVGSMGIHAAAQGIIPQNVLEVCTEHGLDCSAHQSRPLIAEDLAAADYVFAMEMVQQEFVKLFFPRFGDRVFLLGAWPENGKSKLNIKDPMGKPIREFRKTFDQITAHIDRIWSFLPGV